MRILDRLDGILAAATLSRSRALLRSRGGRALSIFIAVAYGLASMLTGQMLILARNPGPHYSLILWSGNGAQPWNYPALLVSAGWGVLALPFFPTVAMLAISAGVGLGMAVSVLLVAQLLRERRQGQGRIAGLGTISGLTPALLALVTLGACCSTTAAATAGLGLVAQASGTTVSQLLAANWYLGVFQILVLWIALVAQEKLVSVYRALTDPGAPGARSDSEGVRPARTSLPATLLRAGLVVGGVLAVVSVPAAWIRSPPGSVGVATWFDWIVGRGFLGMLAIIAGLFPDAAAREVRSIRPGRHAALLLRGGLVAVGFGIAVYVPPPLASWGFFGFGNQLLASLGAPTAWGAVSTNIPPGPTLWISWTFQFVVVGMFSILLALRPRSTLAHLAPSEMGGGQAAPNSGWLGERGRTTPPSFHPQAAPTSPAGRSDS